MAFVIEGLNELQADLARLQAQTGAGNPQYEATVRRVLRAGAEPMKAQMVTNASVNPKPISGALRSSIAIGTIKNRKLDGKAITIGVHRKKGAFYANPVEFGHGGPAPAPAHPFVRPAYDQRVDDAFDAMKDVLENALFTTK